jgi:ATP-dependent Clp protease ATP-binding subunit ClpC
MTTNLGTKQFGEAGKVGFASGDNKRIEVQERVEADLRRAFRPELLNRIDEIIVFSPLSDDDLEKIAKLLLSDLGDRIENNGFFIEFEEDVASAIVRAGKKEEYGARQLRRAITELIEAPFSDAMLRGDFARGDYIAARLSSGRVLFEKKGAK